MERSRTYPVSPPDAFDWLLPAPLPTIFARRYAVLPPISRTEESGVWGTAGQSRKIFMAGGGSLTETLLTVRRPESFTYRLSDITGPTSLIAESINGEWRFSSAGTGTRITWSWTVQPSSKVAAFGLPAFERMWQGYARAALEQVERGLLERPEA